jgi:hypothetical protein
MYIPRCLSVQAALGFKDRYSVRTLPSAVSWGILNLRHASMFFMYFLQHGKGSKEAVEPADSGEKNRHFYLLSFSALHPVMFVSRSTSLTAFFRCPTHGLGQR